MLQCLQYCLPKVLMMDSLKGRTTESLQNPWGWVVEQEGQGREMKSNDERISPFTCKLTQLTSMFLLWAWDLGPGGGDIEMHERLS